MKTGDTIICRGSRGYAFTTGKEYTVLDFSPPFHDSSSAAGFTWPAYVEVLDDNNQRVHCHANRFVPKEN